MTGHHGYVIFFMFSIQFIQAENQLNEYIKNYETLSYNRLELQERHHRAKRSITHTDSTIRLKFTAYSKTFNIRLKRDLNTFSDDLVIVDSTNKQLTLSDADITSHIYHGHISDEPGSVVFGSILDGIFEGKIMSPRSGDFYVEKSSRYFPPQQLSTNNTFHSIVYKDSDIRHPHLEADQYTGCGINEEVRQWMESIQHSEFEEPESKNKILQMKDEIMMKKKHIKKVMEKEYREENPFDKYSKEANEKHRKKRGLWNYREKDRNTCSLYIQTDPLIWKHITEQVNHDPEKTREEILSLIAHHVTAVNYIYRDTKFDGKSKHRNIKFEVQRIKIDDDVQCKPFYRGEVNPFCMENIDVSNFLNLHSMGNHEDFCLAYVFTYRDFTGGTLGLAWVASAAGASGGICEKYKTYTETIGGMYQSMKRSLNTGIITFVNYNSRVPPKVSQLTLAHEIGHNFGSPHDYPSECRPGGLAGNYIMFASATSGDRPNNSKFSSCSVGNISSVLDAIEDNKKRNCFKASEGAFCGNKIVEEGEECDCGYDDAECKDQCCYPRILSDEDRHNNMSARGCARRTNTECSPSQGPCCYSNTCRFVPFNRNFTCKSETDCSYISFCNGVSADCPKAIAKMDKTKCNEGTQLCIKGECRGSICLEWGLNECFLSSNSYPHVDKRKLCELACMNGTNGKCRSTSEFADVVGLPPGGISLRPGSPCDNFQGYCDVFYKCRAVDAEGPLLRLKNMLWSRRTLHTIRQWIVENWWLCVLMTVGFVLFMGLFIKCCAVHTPSSNPRKPPARSFSETLRRPISTLRRMRGTNGNRNGLNIIGRSQDPPPPYSSSHRHRHIPIASAPLASEFDYFHDPTDRRSHRMRQYKV